jgi:peptide deformylase
VTLRPILRFPDPLLRRKAEAVTEFDAGLRALAADLFETMAAAPGVGMTAPHIGVLQRVVVLDLPGDARRVYVNPEILWHSAETVRHEEGSVSMPGVGDEVERPARIRLRWQDLDGSRQSGEADGFLAICLQHEIDQLDGIFWLQRLSRLRRDRLVKKFEKLGRVA